MRYHLSVLAVVVITTVCIWWEDLRNLYKSKTNVSNAKNSVISKSSHIEVTNLRGNDEPKKEKENGKDAPLFVLHIGPPKTGTTTLQMFIAGNEDLLHQDNIYYMGQVRNGDERDLRGFFGPCMTGKADAVCQEKWEEFEKTVEYHYSQNHNLFMSHEMIIRAKNEKIENANLWEHLDPLLSRWRVRVVFTYRRLTDWIPSTYHQAFDPSGPIKTQEKRRSWPDAGGTVIPSFPSYLEDHMRAVQTDRVANYRDLPNVKQRWESHFENVMVFNFHQEGDMVENFYCNMIPEANSLCEHLRSKDKSAELKNPSTDKPLHFYMLADGAYQNGWVAKGISKPEIAQAIEDHSKKLGLGQLTDFPLECLSEEQDKAFLSYSLAYESDVVPDFYLSPRGEKGLRDSFAQAVQKKVFCSVDVQKTLKDDRWKAFFQKLKSGSMDKEKDPGKML